MDVTESRSNKTQHTTCGNRERQDRMKARNLHKQGMSLESIAQEVSKPPEWVKRTIRREGLSNGSQTPGRDEGSIYQRADGVWVASVSLRL